MLKKRTIALFLCIGLVMAGSLQVFGAYFTDVQGHWCQTKIDKWVSDGIINGYPDGTFRPNANITRAEFITLVNKVFGFTSGTNISYPDVPQTDWYYNAVRIARYEGYISGYEDGTMRPNAQITRQEAAKIITVILSLTQNTQVTYGYGDSANMDTWARGYIGAVANAGIMSGYTSGELAGTFGGRRNITRAECVEALWKSKDYLDSQEPAITDYSLTSSTLSPSSTLTVQNLYISYAGNVSVSNVLVLGNIYVDSKTADYTVTLTNVTCEGNVEVTRGNWVLDSCDLKTVTANSTDSTIKVSGRSEVDKIVVNRSVTIDQTNLYSSSYGTDEIDIVAGSNTTTTLQGSFDEVSVNSQNHTVILKSGSISELGVYSSGANVNLANGTQVDNATVDASASILGAGTVKNANVNSNNVTMQRRPGTLTGSRTPTFIGEYTLEVNVTDALTGAKLRNAVVTLPDFGESQTTNTNGYVSFNKVANTTVSYTVTLSGYGTVTSTVSMGGGNKVLDVKMSPTGDYTASITVLDNAGYAIQGAKVRIQLTGNSYTDSAASDKNGLITVKDLSNTTYTYTVYADGYVTSDNQTLTVNGKNVAATIRLHPNTLIVTAVGVDGSTPLEFSIKEPAASNFVMGNGSERKSHSIKYLKVGTNYSIQIASNYYHTLTKSFRLDGTDVTWDNSAKVYRMTVQLISTKEVNYAVTVVESGGTTPISGATVIIKNSANAEVKRANTNVNGVAYLSAIPHGTGYTVTVEATGRVTQNKTNVTINDANTTNTFTMASKRTFVINVTNQFGAVSGATVTVSKPSSDPAFLLSGTTNASGQCTFTDVPDGTFTLTIAKADHDTYSNTNFLVSGTMTSPYNVIMTEHSATVNFTVTNSLTSAPLANAVITVVRTDGRVYATVTTDANGQVSIAIAPGNHSFSMTVGGNPCIIQSGNTFSVANGETKAMSVLATPT